MKLESTTDIRGSFDMPFDLRFSNGRDIPARSRQHLLMDGITESLDAFLRRVARRAVERLVVEEGAAVDGGHHKQDLLAKIQMAVRLRRALDEHIHDLVVFGQDRRLAELGQQDELFEPAVSVRPTWAEIGAALGVSAQAAHRKYGEATRRADPYA